MRWKSVIATLSIAHSLSCGVVEDLVDIPEEDKVEIERAVLSMQQGSLETALLVALTKDVQIADDEAVMAADAGARVSTLFSPATCVESTVIQDTVSLVFDECSGPYGIKNLKGAATLGFVISALGSTSVSLTSASMDTNNTTLALNVTGEMADENGREWTLVTSGAGVTEDLSPMTRTGSFRAKSSGMCVVLDGGWSSTVGETLSTITFAGFERCDAPCPSSGTMALAQTAPTESVELQGEAYTMTFNGDEQIAWANAEGKFGVVSLECNL